MKTQMTDVNVKNLCSRKLLELCTTAEVGQEDLLAIVDELRQRRHYLDKLSSMDRLGSLASLRRPHGGTTH